MASVRLLQTCRIDYGPVYSFWLFSQFERYNGMLGDFPTNQRSILIQLMRQFQNEQELSNITPPADYSEDLQEGLYTFHVKKAHISVSKDTEQHNELLLLAPLFTYTTQKWPDDSIQLCNLPTHITVGMIGDHKMLVSMAHMLQCTQALLS